MTVSEWGIDRGAILYFGIEDWLGQVDSFTKAADIARVNEKHKLLDSVKVYAIILLMGVNGISHSCAIIEEEIY